MSERRVREIPEKRLLLDLQLIKAGAGPAPGPAPAAAAGGEPSPRRRKVYVLDPDWAIVLHALGILSDSEMAALVAQ